MNKGLVASCLAAGALFFGGCDSKTEHHQGDLRQGRFAVDSKEVGSGNFYGKLVLFCSDDVQSWVFETSGAPIYSDGKFNVTSMRSYTGKELLKDYTPATRPKGAYYGPAIEQEIEIVFRKDEGQHGLGYSCRSDLGWVYDHIRKCDGKDSCRVPKEFLGLNEEQRLSAKCLVEKK